MTITHAAVKAPGDTGTSDEWNAAHTISDDLYPRRGFTFIVAASDSEDQDRVDYVCDGTADEVQINQAITDLPAGGGSILLLDGTFTIAAPIVISKSNVALIGSGRATRIETTADISMIFADTKTGILLSRFWLYGAGAGNNLNGGIYFDTVTSSQITNLWIEHMGDVGILFFTNNERILIKGNEITDCLGGIGASTIGRFIISNNNIHGNSGTGIYFFWTSDTLIVNNIIRENGGNGIYIISNTFYNVISNNVIEDNDVNNTASFDGIQLNRADENIIANNRCRNNDRYEINISNVFCDDNLVHGNHCKGTDHVGAINDAGTNTSIWDNVVA